VKVDARPSDAVALALVTGAQIRVDRGVVEASGFVSSSLAAMGSQDEAGPQAILAAPGSTPAPRTPAPRTHCEGGSLLWHSMVAWGEKGRGR
jgi:hypothetical protein